MNVVGLGIDVVEVERMQEVLDRDPRFLRRVFSEDEISFCGQSARPAECYAVRWAAREACAKALGGIPQGRWRDIRVIRAGDGNVAVELEGAAKERASQVGAQRMLLSLAHEKSQAVACCLALGS